MSASYLSQSQTRVVMNYPDILTFLTLNLLINLYWEDDYEFIQ